MIEIECEDPTETVCDCCGNTTTRLTRFVYKDNDAYAVYYAAFTKGHPEKRLSGLISLGEWAEGSTPEDRRAFAFQIWIDNENYQVGLVDADQSSWKDAKTMGRVLDREEALKDEWISEVFHITDHMLSDDKEIINYFSN